MEDRKPKESLAGQDLIGFARHPAAGGQVVHRASSAKVTIKSGFLPEAGDRNPKEQLADRDLMGFMQRQAANGQVAHRASSAKVSKPGLAAAARQVSADASDEA